MWYLFIVKIDRHSSQYAIEADNHESASSILYNRKLPSNFGATSGVVIYSFESESEIKIIDNLEKKQ